MFSFRSSGVGIRLTSIWMFNEWIQLVDWQEKEKQVKYINIHSFNQLHPSWRLFWSFQGKINEQVEKWEWPIIMMNFRKIDRKVKKFRHANYPYSYLILCINPLQRIQRFLIWVLEKKNDVQISFSLLIALLLVSLILTCRDSNIDLHIETRTERKLSARSKSIIAHF